MTDDVMVDPPRENIDGEKIVHHRFDHGVDWSVNVSHLLVALALFAALVWWVTRDQDDDEDAMPGGTR